MQFCLPESGSSKVSSLRHSKLNVTVLCQFENRKALDLVCEPLARLQNRRGTSSRNARPKVDGTLGERKRDLPSARGAFLSVLRRDHPPGHAEFARAWTITLARPRRDHDDHRGLQDSLSEVSCHCAPISMARSTPPRAKTMMKNPLNVVNGAGLASRGQILRICRLVICFFLTLDCAVLLMLTLIYNLACLNSSVTFAMRKQLQAEHGKADLEKRITELDAKKKKQSNKVIELKSKIEAINTRNQARRDVETKKRKEEIAFLNY